VRLWDLQSVWSQGADRVKRSIGKARTAGLVLGIAAAGLATAASQVMAWSAPLGKTLAFVAAVAAGLAPPAAARSGPQAAWHTGFDEFREFWPTRRLNSVFSVSSSPIRSSFCASDAINAPTCTSNASSRAVNTSIVVACTETSTSNSSRDNPPRPDTTQDHHETVATHAPRNTGASTPE
jgi:hypothetical protein